jgi:hypothetical protein
MEMFGCSTIAGLCEHKENARFFLNFHHFRRHMETAVAKARKSVKREIFRVKRKVQKIKLKQFGNPAKQ